MATSYSLIIMMNSVCFELHLSRWCWCLSCSEVGWLGAAKYAPGSQPCLASPEPQSCTPAFLSLCESESPRSLGWPWTCDSSATVSWIAGLRGQGQQAHPSYLFSARILTPLVLWPRMAEKEGVFACLHFNNISFLSSSLWACYGSVRLRLIK